MLTTRVETRVPCLVGSCYCQVLRYNESQAYVVHYDYLESAEGHDFKSEELGTNRFATVSTNLSLSVWWVVLVEFGMGSAPGDAFCISMLETLNYRNRLICIINSVLSWEWKRT